MEFNWIKERFVFPNGTWRGRKMSEVKCEFLTSYSRLSIFFFELSSNANIFPEKFSFLTWKKYGIKLITHFDEILVKIFILSYIRVCRMIVSLLQNWIRIEISSFSKALQMCLSLEISTQIERRRKNTEAFLTVNH